MIFIIYIILCLNCYALPISNLNILANRSLQDHQDNWPDYIYTSLTVNQVKVKQICEYGQMIDISPITLDFTQGNHQFFANLVECGFGLFDSSNPLQVKMIYQNKQLQPLKLQILEDDRLYISALDQQVYIFDIKIPKAPLLIQKISAQQNIHRFQMILDKNLLILLGGSDIYILSNQQNNQQKYELIQKINQIGVVESLVYYKSINSQEEFFLIGSPYPILYKISYSNGQQNQSQFILNQVCQIQNDRMTSYVIVKQRFLYYQTFFAGIFLLDLENAVTALYQDCIQIKNSVLSLFGNYQDIQGIQLFGNQNKIMISVAIYGIYIFNIDPEKQLFQMIQYIQIQGICNSLALTKYSANQPNKSSDFILYSSEDSLLIFQKTQLNDYLEIPNLLNLQQATLNDQQKELWTWAYHCAVDEKTGTIFTTSSSNGMFALSQSSEFSQDKFLLTYNKNPPKLLIDWDAAEGLAIHPSSKYVFVGVSNAGLMIMDVSDLDDIQTIAVTTFGFIDAELDVIRISTEGNILILAAGYQGIIVASVKDIYNPKLLKNLYTFNPKNLPCKSVAFGKDEKIVFATYRYYGVVAIDISDAILKQDFQDTSGIVINQLSTIVTQGAEDLILTSDKRYIILSDAFKGITVIDAIDPKNMKIISNVKTEGWSLHLHFIDNQERYLITNSREFGQIFLIDLSNKYYPRLIQKYKYLNQDGSQDICLSPDRKVGYMLSTQGIVLMSLRSKLIFNFNFFTVNNQPISQNNEISSNNQVSDIILISSKSNKLLDLNQRGLLVGEQVIIKMAQILPSASIQDVKVNRVLSYSNYQLIDIPSWITFSQTDLTLSINVQKESLLNKILDDQKFPNSQEVNVSENWIVLVIVEQISSKDFIKSQGEIIVSEDMANKIYNDCLDLDIITQNNYVNDSINDKLAAVKLLSYDTNLFKQNVQTSSPIITVLNFVLSVLKSKVTYYPIRFYTQSSLTVNIIDQTKPCISTVSINTISVFLTIKREEASFIDKKYSGVIITLSEQQDTIKLEGQLVLVNNILRQGVKLHIWDSSKISDVQVNIQVQDGGINFPVQKSFSAVSSFIISLNQPVVASKNPSLQQNFNSVFSEGKISILEKFSYTFPTNAFLDNDSPNLSYQVKLKTSFSNSGDLTENNTQEGIPQGYWLTFTPNERTFQGTPLTSSYYEEITIIVTATDGYFKAQDEFTILIRLIPFTYILYITIQIIGPILGILGMWRYKSVIYNFVKKSSLQLTPKIIQVGEKLQIQIPLLEFEIQAAQKILTSFLDTIDRQSVILQINIAKQNYFDSQYSLRMERKEQEENEQFSPNTKNKLIYPLQSNQVLQIKGEIDQISQKNQINTICQEDFQDTTSGLQSRRSRGQPTLEEMNPQHFQNNLVSNQLKRITRVKRQIKQKVELIKKKIQVKKSTEYFVSNRGTFCSASNKLSGQDEEKQSREDQFFTNNGELNNQYLIQCINKFLQDQKFIIKGINSIHMDIIKMQLSQCESSFSRILVGLFSVFLSESDRVTSEIINLLKQYSIPKHSTNDWYKEYVKVNPQFDSIFFDVFPKLTLNFTNLQNSLEKFFKFSSNPSFPVNLSSTYQQNLVPLDALIPLIEQTLYANALGFTFQPFSLISKPRGECLVIQPNKVRSVKVFIPSKSQTGISNQLRKCLNLDQENEMSLVENQKLPSWIRSVDVRNNTILIEGAPNEKDIGSYLLKIFDDQNFVIRSQEINVISNPNLIINKNIGQIRKQQSIISNSEEFDIPLEDNKQEDIFKTLQFSRQTKKNQTSDLQKYESQNTDSVQTNNQINQQRSKQEYQQPKADFTKFTFITNRNEIDSEFNLNSYQ